MTKKTETADQSVEDDFLTYASKWAKIGFREQALGFEHPKTQEALEELREYQRSRAGD